jgi:flagellar biosynthesis protein FlhA
MSPPAVQKTCEIIGAEVAKLSRANLPAVILVSPHIRPGLKQITAGALPRLTVLSYNEITRDTQIESVGLVVDVVPAKK